MTGFYLHPNSKMEIIDSHEEDIIVTKSDGIIVKATHISGRHYGLHAEELLGKSVYDLEKKGVFSPAITPLVLQQKKKVVAIQSTPSGQKVLITGMPFFDEQGNISFVISYSYEVSELIVIQEYMKDLEYEMLLAKEELLLLRKEMLLTEQQIVKSRSTIKAYETAERVAGLDVSVVLIGEHGTGKTTLAKAIHKESSRKDDSFIEVNCDIIPESLFEEVLFGSASNSHRKIGLLALAQAGTLYFKSIDKLSISHQALIAKLLKDGGYTPPGELQKITINVRILASAESELAELVAKKKFQKELYYLLNIIPIHLLPLRDRKEDLSALISFHLIEFSKKYATIKHFSKDLFSLLLNHHWEGNHYELKNVIERLVVQSASGIITIDDLPPEYHIQPNDELAWIGIEGRTLPNILESVEMKVLKDAQERYRTTTEMAKVLGISQPSVVRKLQKYLRLIEED